MAERRKEKFVYYMLLRLMLTVFIEWFIVCAVFLTQNIRPESASIRRDKENKFQKK